MFSEVAACLGAFPLPTFEGETYGACELTATLVRTGLVSPPSLATGVFANSRTLTSSRKRDVSGNLSCEVL